MLESSITAQELIQTLRTVHLTVDDEPLLRVYAHIQIAFHAVHAPIEQPGTSEAWVWELMGTGFRSGWFKLEKKPKQRNQRKSHAIQAVGYDVQAAAVDLLDGFWNLHRVQQLGGSVRRDVVETAVEHLGNLSADRFGEGCQCVARLWKRKRKSTACVVCEVFCCCRLRQTRR